MEEKCEEGSGIGRVDVINAPFFLGCWLLFGWVLSHDNEVLATEHKLISSTLMLNTHLTHSTANLVLLDFRVDNSMELLS